MLEFAESYGTEISSSAIASGAGMKLWGDSGVRVRDSFSYLADGSGGPEVRYRDDRFGDQPRAIDNPRALDVGVGRGSGRARGGGDREAQAIPCLVSDRGGLPEMGGEGGCVIELPRTTTLETDVVSEGLERWVHEIERLATDEDYYAGAMRTARQSGARFARETLMLRYAAWFATLC